MKYITYIAKLQLMTFPVKIHL